MKRFVSYLYSIYNNQKIHNAGFARMELRTGRNRVDIHLKENGYAGKTGTVYLFIRKQENIQGISIGNITFRGNQADFRYEQAEENIGQTPWQIMQMNGILIMIDDRAAFLSQWDEQPVDTARFEVWNVDKLKEESLEEDLKKELQEIQKENSEEGRQADPQNALKEGLQAGQKKVLEESRQADQKNALEESPQAGRKNALEESRQTGQKSALEESRQAGQKKVLEESRQAGQKKVSEEGRQANQKKILGEDRQADQKKALEEGLRANMKEERLNGENLNSGNLKEGNLGGNHSEERNINGNAEMNIQTAELQPQVRSQWDQTWRYMLRMYPVLNQFADNNNILCVRIEIKDVRLLPEKYWSMVNNSFLLHGFFNYRYLAFGRMGQNWFVGIPGVYQNQEHVMASIFGFPDFLPQSQKNERGEQPGYWYRILEI